MSLSAGFAEFRQLDDSGDDHLDSLLRTLMESEMESPTGERFEVDFVTWRGMMTKVSHQCFFECLLDETVLIMQNRSWRRHMDSMRGGLLNARFDHQVSDLTRSSFEMNATCFQVSHVYVQCCRRLHTNLVIGIGNNVTVLVDFLLACRKTDAIRFLEEDRIAKLASRHEQMSQPSRPGMPSQDLMSYWGSHLAFDRSRTGNNVILRLQIRDSFSDPRHVGRYTKRGH